jgi:hypothetical protein
MNCFEYFAIGGDNDHSAFTINEELRGNTFRCKTYNNEPLHLNKDDSSFECIELEVYILI